jgi:hypothetical protein
MELSSTLAGLWAHVKVATRRYGRYTLWWRRRWLGRGLGSGKLAHVIRSGFVVAANVISCQGSEAR